MKLVLKYTFVFLLALFTSLLIFNTFKDKGISILTKDYFIAGLDNEVSIYNDNFEEVKKVYRGTKVKSDGKTIDNSDKKYQEINYNNSTYYILKDNLVDNKAKVVLEKVRYIRTPVTVYESSDTSKILSFIKKGEKVEVLEYSSLSNEGIVDKYKIKYNNIEGYIYGKYTVSSEELALRNYDEDGNYQIHKSRTNTLGGGSAGNLDYYPNEKVKFTDNVMPTEVRSLYINSGAIYNVDKYIEFAKENNINAFVVDIKDNTSPAYKSPVMKKYSPTNYQKAFNSLENYQTYIKKLKDAGFYVIGRITAFKDDYYAIDHPENTIFDKDTNSAFIHNGSKWPSAFNRDVWEFNVELAKEGITLIGFNEIQFDYVRFPDRVGATREQTLDYRNKYNEEKAQAIQNFLFYAADEIHGVHGYISADVFGESAHNYVSAYGQYWAAISNVVDVISGMPYPDLFNKYEYGFKVPVWTVPYDLLSFWANNYVVKQQNTIPTPAIVRTWVAAYDAYWKSPNFICDADTMDKQIDALYDAGLTGGYITWNANSSIGKYTALKDSFNKNHLE